MQIDIHYYAAYAMARLAGLRPRAARTIATASQYVDDAVDADILSFQGGKTQRSQKWRTAFTKGELGIKPGEKIPLYDPAPWDKQRNHFPGLDKPEKAAASNVYHFYQAASLHQHTLLRELLPKNKLILV